MLVRLVGNAAFWINAFPHKDGVSTSLSPRYIMTRRHLDATKHVRYEFGSYVQTHEEHTSDMRTRTIGAIYLGPCGHEQGGQYFMALGSRKLIHCQYWTEMPMPSEVIDQINQYGMRDKMPQSLNFDNCVGLHPEYYNKDNDNHHSVHSSNEDDQSSHSSSELDSLEDSDLRNEQPKILEPVHITEVGYENLENGDKKNVDTMLPHVFETKAM
jgi:hypothetical protein